MSKRNIYFGGFSMLVAGAAIAGGAAVSSSAMADGGTPTDELNTVQVVSVSSDGEAIECTFDGFDFPSFVMTMPADGQDGVIAVSGAVTIDDTATVDGTLPTEELPAGAVPLDGDVFTVTVGEDGVATSSDGTVLEPGTQVSQGGGTISVGVGSGPLTPEQMDELLANVQIISAADARPGTPEECAAMMPVPPTQASSEG